MPNQKPTVGRIVHYQSYGTPKGEYQSTARAAIVTEVNDLPPTAEGGTPEERVLIGVAVLNPAGLFFDRGVAYNADGRPGTWRWPPMENGKR